MRFSFVCRFDGCWARRFTRRRLNPEPFCRLLHSHEAHQLQDAL